MDRPFFTVPLSSGADEGSRTLLSSLGSWRSTDELHPHQLPYHDIISGPLLPVGFAGWVRDAPKGREGSEGSEGSKGSKGSEGGGGGFAADFKEKGRGWRRGLCRRVLFAFAQGATAPTALRGVDCPNGQCL